MFKTAVVFGACVLIYLHLITACSVTETQPRIELSASSRQSIARELITAISANSHDTTQPIYVRADGDHEWLQRALVAELNKKQYLLTTDAKGGRHLDVLPTDLGTNGIHVSLTLDGNRTIERVFRFEPTHTFKSPIDSVSFHVVSATAESASHSSDTQANVGNETQSAHAETLVGTPRMKNPPTNLAKVNEPPDSMACTDVVLYQGSLKRNVTRILKSCGWQLINWPADPNKPHHELDWLVPGTQVLAFASLDGLLDALSNTFDLDVELNHRFKSVRIQVRD